MSAVPTRKPRPLRNPSDVPIFAVRMALTVLSAMPLVALAIVALAPTQVWAPVVAFSAPLAVASTLMAAFILRPLFDPRSAADSRRRQR
jgi:hypothetical protein